MAMITADKAGKAIMGASCRTRCCTLETQLGTKLSQQRTRENEFLRLPALSLLHTSASVPCMNYMYTVSLYILTIISQCLNAMTIVTFSQQCKDLDNLHCQTWQPGTRFPTLCTLCTLRMRQASGMSAIQVKGAALLSSTSRICHAFAPTPLVDMYVSRLLVCCWIFGT